MLLNGLIVLALFWQENVVECANFKTSSEKLLIQQLLNRYKQNGVIGRPVNHSRVQMWVQYGLQLIQILGLDENKQILRTNCWTVYKWNDPLLRWNHSEFDGIKTIRILPRHIWTPDIKLQNFADERLQEVRDSGLLVNHDGSILWSQQALFKSTCQIEITYFPFDTQVCMLEFGSLVYDKDLLELEWWTPDDSETPMPYVDFSDYVPANEWITDGEEERHIPHELRIKQIRSVKRYRVTGNFDGKRGKEFPILRFLIRLHRNPSFHMFLLVAPCIMLCFMTLVVFWLPPDSAAKLMLGINIFVAFFVLLLLLSESMPSAVRNFPLIGIFFLVNMAMVTLSTFLSTVVVNLFYRGADGRLPPVWVRRIVIDRIGSCLHLRDNIPMRARITSAPTSEKLGHFEMGSRNANDLTTNFNDDDGVATAHMKKLRVNIESLRLRHTVQDKGELAGVEWRTLALIVDRLFFILYILFMILILLLVAWNTETTDMSQLLRDRQ